MSCPHLTSVGAYVLGALAVAERAEFEAHLDDCPSCRAEMLRQAPLPGLLHRITVEDYESEPSADPPIPKPTRKRWRLVAACVVLAVTVGVGAFFVAREPAETHWSATDEATGVTADVAMTGRDWGTEVHVTLRDVPPGKPCKLVVRGHDGSREIAGWWSTTFAAGESVPGSTSFDLARIARFEVVTDDDVILVAVPAPS